ncbi:AbrB family transcriptional regulator [Pseudomonas sp. NFACC45]|uniref:AbrB family transcriptional regulator n=1 Tax=Pseudomonas sp. NFACC45 TaxID=1566201 RepID=UPI00210AA625|nr:AbrB family transcriptional regulator [Pseudomonas sp. NFACC45]
MTRAKVEGVVMGVNIFDVSRLLLLYVLCFGVGRVFLEVGMPLPFMIGPLMLTAFLYISGLMKAAVPAKTRPCGQMIIASTVGLAFTSEALAVIFEMGLAIIGLAVLTGLSALLVSLLLKRFTRLDYSTALLCTIPTSPVEAAVIAERFGLNKAVVVLSQTIRIASVVVIVPIALYVMDGWPGNAERSSGGVGQFDPGGVLLLAISALTGAMLFRLLRLPNPYFFGALLVSAAVSSSGLHVAPYPSLIMAAAQVVLGTWLGSVFTKDLFLEVRLTLSIVISMLFFLLLTSLMAVAFAVLSGFPWEVMLLSAAPGGVTEMALTAQFLGYNVAVIVSFQIVRICIFMPGVHWFIAVARRFELGRSS